MTIGRPRKTPPTYKLFWVQLSSETVKLLERYAKQLEGERPGARVTKQDAARAALATWGAAYAKRGR
jgi:hypothetical protein